MLLVSFPNANEVWSVELMIDGRLLTVKLDTAADVNIMGVLDFRTISLKKLINTKARPRLTAYGGYNVPLVGRVSLDVVVPVGLTVLHGILPLPLKCHFLVVKTVEYPYLIDAKSWRLQRGTKFAEIRQSWRFWHYIILFLGVHLRWEYDYLSWKHVHMYKTYHLQCKIDKKGS